MTRASSGSAVAVVLRRSREVRAGEHPLLARTLAYHGISMRKAHAIVDRVATGEEVAVELPKVPDLDKLREDLDADGIVLTPRAVPRMIDLKALRERRRLTQEEFAARYALKLDTVQNWEQGRANNIDRAARILLSLIERHPDLVEDAVEEAAARERA